MVGHDFLLFSLRSEPGSADQGWGQKICPLYRMSLKISSYGQISCSYLWFIGHRNFEMIINFKYAQRQGFHFLHTCWWVFRLAGMSKKICREEVGDPTANPSCNKGDRSQDGRELLDHKPIMFRPSIRSWREGAHFWNIWEISGILEDQARKYRISEICQRFEGRHMISGYWLRKN